MVAEICHHTIDMYTEVEFKFIVYAVISKYPQSYWPKAYILSIKTLFLKA